MKLTNKEIDKTIELLIRARDNGFEVNCEKIEFINKVEESSKQQNYCGEEIFSRTKSTLKLDINWIELIA